MEDSHIPTPEERRRQREENEDYTPVGNTLLRTIFGVIMIIVYVGMGVLFLVNFFGWEGDWAWSRYLVGVVLIIYGFWRAYRQYAGIDKPL